MSVADLIPGMAPKRAEKFDERKGVWFVTVTPPEFMGGESRTVILSTEQYRRYASWRAGTQLIQNALPELTAGERETLMSGL